MCRFDLEPNSLKCDSSSPGTAKYLTAAMPIHRAASRQALVANPNSER